PFKKLNFGDIAPHHIEEMNVSMATMYNIVLVQNSIFQVKDDLSKKLDEQTITITKMFENHKGVCPVNKEAVEGIVHEELMSENVKELMQKELMSAAIHQIDKGSKIIRYAWRVVLVIFVLLNIYLVFKGKSPIQITP
ncbi:MAG: hypothetical protein ACYC6C_14400, partial [Coriobacteriia bacterium]